MAHEYHRRRRIEFAETDMAGIVHFSSYCRYLEETEHEFLRSLGLSVHPRQHVELEGDESERVGFPRLGVRLEFMKPLRFEDEVDIHLRVLRVGRASLSYQYDLECAGERVAIGEMSVACVRMDSGGKLVGTPLPSRFRDRLVESPLEPLVFRESKPTGARGARPGGGGAE